MIGKSRFSDGLWNFSMGFSSGTTTSSPTFTLKVLAAAQISPDAVFTRTYV